MPEPGKPLTGRSFVHHTTTRTEPSTARNDFDRHSLRSCSFTVQLYHNDVTRRTHVEFSVHRGGFSDCQSLTPPMAL